MSDVETNTAKPIPRRILRAAARALRFQCLWLLNSSFARSGMTEEALAVRLGWPVSRVRKILRGQRRLTLRSLGALVYAIDGSSIEFSAKPKSSAEPSP